MERKRLCFRRTAKGKKEDLKNVFGKKAEKKKKRDN